MFTNKTPQVSVIMPVYNGEKYLNEAIDSILQQFFIDFEFIIINDGSTDRSREIIESYKDDRIILINQKKQGVAKSINYGIKRANGKYIARMDADDISYPDRLEIQVNYLENNMKLIAVGSNADVINKDGNYVYTTNLELSNDNLKKNLLHKSPFIHPSLMVRSKELERTGFYPDVPLVEDLLLFNALAKYGDYANIDKPLIKYRLTPEASSRRSKNTQKITYKVLADFIKNGKVTDEHVICIKESIAKTDINEKYYRYYLRLAKKYLWNNYQPLLARKNIKKGLKYNKTDPMLLLLYLLSFFPENTIRGIYQKLKSK